MPPAGRRATRARYGQDQCQVDGEEGQQEAQREGAALQVGNDQMVHRPVRQAQQDEAQGERVELETRGERGERRGQEISARQQLQAG